MIELSLFVKTKQKSGSLEPHKRKQMSCIKKENVQIRPKKLDLQVISTQKSSERCRTRNKKKRVIGHSLFVETVQKPGYSQPWNWKQTSVNSTENVPS